LKNVQKRKVQFFSTDWLIQTPGAFSSIVGLVLGAVILLLGAKPFSDFLGRPSHLNEITAECTSAATFYCLPTVDRTGDPNCLLAKQRTGTGIYLHDSRIGKSQILIKFKEGTFESGITLPDPRGSCLFTVVTG